MQINASPISSDHEVPCPACGVAVLIAQPTGCEVPGGGSWLRDGDTVGPLFPRLTPEQLSRVENLHCLMVGTCKHCLMDYYIAEASFVSADHDNDRALTYLLDGADSGRMKNLLCSTPTQSPVLPSQWLLSEFETDIGPMHVHTFGPWTLASLEGVEGRHGVSSCGEVAADPWQHAANVLHIAWDAMVRRCVEASA